MKTRCQGRIAWSRWALTLFASLLIGQGYAEEADEAPPPAAIKVLVKRDEEGALIEVKGAFKVLNPVNRQYLSSGFRGKRFFLYACENGIKWGEFFPSIYQIRIQPNDPDTTVLVDGIE